MVFVITLRDVLGLIVLFAFINFIVFLTYKWRGVLIVWLIAFILFAIIYGLIKLLS